MKKLLLALTLMGFQAMADSPFLPISATNTFKSGERAQVEAAIAQAELEGKLVFIDMAAAWCGPCLALDKEMEEKAELLAPTLSHFVYVKLEEMHLEMMAGVDFMAHEIPWFPSLYVFNPSNHKWTFVYATQVDTLKVLLDKYVDHGELAGPLNAALNEALAGEGAVDPDMILDAIFAASTESSGADFLNTVSRVLQAFNANPARFTFSMEELEGQLSFAYQRAIEMGNVTFDEVRAMDPASFAGVETDIYGFSDLFFDTPLSRLVRSQGNKVASDQCVALSQTVLQKMAGVATDEELALFNLVHALQCTHLKAQLKEAGRADVDAIVALMDDTQKTQLSRSLAKTYAQTGDSFDKAAEFAGIWKARYEKAYEAHAELLLRIKTATDQVLAAFAAGKTHP